MTQLVLNISDPSVLPTLKKVVKAFNGVSIAPKTEKKEKKAKCGLDEALEDVKAGRVYHAKSTDDLFQQILGI